ncbi:hypothetical protein RCG23_25170 [Neobacillus sp. PS3-34]|uniref:HNH endonuclease n=1 Tax=Neobacillus sp. PS3-34 TaxID=3070678 RepID=UPI0027DF78BD|nr:HNH endonuclease [Neobacillus sp. PS3-34]WML48479.1 hypothetical protein RCG23_25170 [Neobacillus sp. PS3-34]
MNNDYLIDAKVVTLYLKDSTNNITGEALIDIEDLEKVKEFPNTWRYQKLGNRVEVRGTITNNGIKKQTTLTKWILDFPSKPIYFIDGNPLNNRKENLSFNKPLKGNAIEVHDDVAYMSINRRNEEGLVIKIDSNQLDLVKKYTWICEKKKDIDDYVVYTKIYDVSSSKKQTLRKVLLGNSDEKTAYFVNGDRLDFRMENIKLYSEQMTNKYLKETGIVHIFLKVKNEENYVVTMIDEEDLLKVSSLGYTWHYYQGNGEPYAVNTIVINGDRRRVYLHRVVMDAPEDKIVDHINHDTLDNRKRNLRNVTFSENQQNRKGANKNSLSGVRNVNWDATNNDWIVTCGSKYIMRTKDFEKAKLAAIRVRKELFPFATK